MRKHKNTLDANTGTTHIVRQYYDYAPSVCIGLSVCGKLNGKLGMLADFARCMPGVCVRKPCVWESAHDYFGRLIRRSQRLRQFVLSALN